MSDKVTLVIRIDAGLINVNPETVEEALNKYFAPDGAVSVFYAAQQSVQRTDLESALFDGFEVVEIGEAKYRLVPIRR